MVLQKGPKPGYETAYKLVSATDSTCVLFVPAHPRLFYDGQGPRMREILEQGPPLGHSRVQLQYKIVQDLTPVMPSS
jgi:hypothetical protein